jgi:hypothetical protein
MHRTVLSMLLVIAGLGLFAGCHHDRDEKGENEKGEQKKLALHPPTGTPKRPQGMTALTIKPGAEPFSKQDVVAYFQTHNFPKNVGSVAQFQVDTLEFITSKDVSQRLHGVSTGLEDNARVGFVTLTGTFIFTGPGSNRKSATFNRAYAVFDAANGNLLMVGTLEQTDKPR